MNAFWDPRPPLYSEAFVPSVGQNHLMSTASVSQAEAQYVAHAEAVATYIPPRAPIGCEQASGDKIVRPFVNEAAEEDDDDDDARRSIGNDDDDDGGGDNGDGGDDDDDDIDDDGVGYNDDEDDDIDDDLDDLDDDGDGAGRGAVVDFSLPPSNNDGVQQQQEVDEFAFLRHLGMSSGESLDELMRGVFGDSVDVHSEFAASWRLRQLNMIATAAVAASSSHDDVDAGADDDNEDELDGDGAGDDIDEIPQ